MYITIYDPSYLYFLSKQISAASKFDTYSCTNCLNFVHGQLCTICIRKKENKGIFVISVSSLKPLKGVRKCISCIWYHCGSVSYSWHVLIFRCEDYITSVFMLTHGQIWWMVSFLPLMVKWSLYWSTCCSLMPPAGQRYERRLEFASSLAQHTEADTYFLVSCDGGEDPPNYYLLRVSLNNCVLATANLKF